MKNKIFKYKNLMRTSNALMLVGIAFTIAFVLIFFSFSGKVTYEREIDPAVWGQFGDIMGGVVGTIFSLIGVLLLYKTLTLQRKQERNQTKQVAKEQIAIRFYELLKIQRENSSGITVGHKIGRKVFIQMERELKLCFRLMPEYEQLSDTHLTESERINLVYLIFFYGAVGETSVRILRNVTKGKYPSSIMNNIIEHLGDTQKGFKTSEKFDWLPFSGHQSRLGHYYRHFYQTVTYINRLKILTYREKYDYIKTLRAQLSTHEQVLLLWNSLSDLGVNWERKQGLDINDQLITKYNLVKNIPDGHIGGFNMLNYYPNVDYEVYPSGAARIALVKLYK